MYIYTLLFVKKKVYVNIFGSISFDTDYFVSQEMNITDLPPEVVLTIFLHLKTKFVLSTLTQVCKLFYHLITPDSTWKTRFWKLWPDKTTNNDSQYISRLANKYFTVKLFNFL